MFDVDGRALLAFCRTLRIVNQDTGAITPLAPNAEQRDVVEKITRWDTIILKSRQVGISTIVLAFDLAFAIANPGIPVTLALDTDDNAKKLLSTLCGWCKRDLGMRLLKADEHVVILPNGSRIQAVTSGSRAAAGQSRTGRSGSAGLIHISELAFWTNDQATFQSLTSTALKGCRIIVESTATPSNSLFRALWTRAETGESDAFVPLFLSLELHAAYREDPSSITDERWEQLRETESFTRRDTAAWFERQLTGRFAGDIHGLRREYPPTARAAFSMAKGRWIGHFVRAPVLEAADGWTIFRQQDDLDEPVAMGIDVGKGTGRDFSCIVVMGYESRDIVATFYTNTLALPAFTNVLRGAVGFYRPRGWTIESNGIGAMVFQEAATWGLPGLREQTSSDNNGEKHWRMTRLKWSIEREVTHVGPEMALEIEGSDKVAPSIIDEDGNYVGRDDMLNAASFALKIVEREPWTRPVKSVDPHAVFAPGLLHERARLGATGI